MARSTSIICAVVSHGSESSGVLMLGMLSIDYLTTCDSGKNERHENQ